MSIKQHIVVDISNESFITNPYNNNITGGIDISGIGRTVIRSDGTTEFTNSLTAKNIQDDTIKITPTELNISGVGNINMDTIGNAIFSSNNTNNITISSETINIDSFNNTGLHIKKQPRENANIDFDESLTNTGNIIISEHGNCSRLNAIAGNIQFEASPFNHNDSNNSQFVDKCGQIALTHESIVGNDTWGFSFNLIGENSYTSNGRKLYEVLKLSGKDRVGICGKDPERNLDVSGSFRVTNDKNYLNINNDGKIDISGNIDLSGSINHLGNTDIIGNIDILGDIEGNINDLFTIKNNNNDQQFTINNIGNVGIGSSVATEKFEITDGSCALINSTNFITNPQPETIVNNLIFKHDTNPRYSEKTINTAAKISSFMETSLYDTQSGSTGISFFTASGWKNPTNTLSNPNDVDLTLTEKMRITSTGNIGIGTTNPAEKLAVNGNITLNNSIKFYNGGILSQDTSRYGTLRITGNANNGYNGLGLGAEHQIMSDGTHFGLYTGHTPGTAKWMLHGKVNDAVSLMYNGLTKIQTLTDGMKCHGVIYTSSGVIAHGPTGYKNVKIGGPNGSTNDEARITSSGNLHMESPSIGDIYLNWHNTRDVRIRNRLKLCGSVTSANYSPEGPLHIIGERQASAGNYNINIVLQNRNKWTRMAIGMDDSKSNSDGDIHFFRKYNNESNYTRIGYIQDNKSSESQMNFTGAHNCRFGYEESFEIGMIVSSTGKYNNYVKKNGSYNTTSEININEALPIVQLTKIKKDKSIFGVIAKIEDGTEKERNYGIDFFKSVVIIENDGRRLAINGVGEGGIWVINTNGNLENGDYMQSSDTVGYAEKQDDELMRNYTVGKITCDCNFDLNSTIYKCESIGNGILRAFVGCIYTCS